MKEDQIRKVIHSVKVGIALVLVSLLYLVDSLYEQVGENAVWAIMTVVVVFEFSAGATLGKGINRAIGTALGGGFGCLAAALAQQISGNGNAIAVATFIFVFGASATYVRLVPSVKRKYEYGVVIFILTFNLVVVSGKQEGKVVVLARDRLATIGIGIAICIFTSLLILPTWTGDQLHRSVALNFTHLADSLQGCLEEYFMTFEKDKDQLASCSKVLSSCKSVLSSKTSEESLANFARWEPWHRKFGLNYPWKKYLHVGELLRELATTIISLNTCLQSPRQPSTTVREAVKCQCEAIGSSIAWTLTEVGESILRMRRLQVGAVIEPKLKSVRQDISLLMSSSKLQGTVPAGNTSEALAMATFIFLLTEMVEKVEDLAKEVEELGGVAQFQA